jgi:nucleoside-diphosphate-sugar epimerase
MTEITVEKFYLNTRVLLTGGGGFIGSRLRKKLSGIGAAVYSLDNKPAAAPGSSDICCDIRDAKALRAAVAGVAPEIVFHLAACVDRAQTPDLIKPMLEANLFGTLNLFESLRGASSCRAMVVSGTAEEYGRAAAPFLESYREDPVGPYSLSKVCVAHLARMFFNVYALPVMVLRPTLAYGPGQEPVMFIPALIKTLLRGDRFPMTPGEQTRDFIYVDDLVNAYLHAGISGKGFGRVFNIGSGVPRKLMDVARMTAALLNKESLLDMGAKNYRAAEIMDYRVDISLAKESFGWSPETSLDKGLRLTIEDYAERPA